MLSVLVLVARGAGAGENSGYQAQVWVVRIGIRAEKMPSSGIKSGVRLVGIGGKVYSKSRSCPILTSAPHIIYGSPVAIAVHGSE